MGPHSKNWMPAATQLNNQKTHSALSQLKMKTFLFGDMNKCGPIKSEKIWMEQFIISVRMKTENDASKYSYEKITKHFLNAIEPAWKKPV